ncbi:YdcF family protein [Psychrobacter lutiphocae]|uniref:YdcF family protein n=1 Tax=Psychrobacter lutiphocae TaxID=540500 RepID=UPI00037432E7|nr:YdcF family protein [Psychrobacter lutiphocae]
MGSLLKRCYLGVKKGSYYALSLLVLSVLCFFTPIFSTLGLWLINQLPVPVVSEFQATANVQQNKSSASDQSYPLKQHTPSTAPTAYVVLGGGLTEKTSFDKSHSNDIRNSPKSDESKSNKDNQIVLNAYSLNRMQTVLAHYQQHPLPIIATGVEAPWMREWLAQQGVDNVITENASMNTCENARFTAKRLKLTNVYLVTDAYHMTRTRRQFGLNHIQTTPIIAPLPMRKDWLKPKNNAQHSRRTLYELAAYIRDIIAPQQNCREADEVSFATLLRSRKPEDVKTF